MESEGHKHIKNFLRSIYEWWVGLGEAAWVVLGFMLLIGVIGGFLILRRIWRHGISRQAAFARHDEGNNLSSNNH
jgi:hypothetical protein